jgi:hypothetical protein
MSGFANQDICSWREFYDFVFARDGEWIYRGQPKGCGEPSTTLERALSGWSIGLEKATSIEFQTIREFRRRLRDPQHHRVHSDTLFCLALMRHHGAPTRLLDCTYSPFVAAAFALEDGFASEKGPPAIWCFRARWCDQAAEKAVSPLKFVDLRNDDRNRADETFIPLYQLGPSTPVQSDDRRFVKPENPFHLNERLTTQQGVFLCPTDLAVSFVDNLKAMPHWDLNSNVVKLSLRLDQQKAIEFARHLKLMNLSLAALFPDLDGFARSIRQQIFHYRELAEKRAGLPLSVG